MRRIPDAPPVILPVPASETRPLWSVMIPVYNCARFLPATLQSVLNQANTETEMQIEVIDDASSDADIETLVKQIGKGRIKYFRQEQNVGSLRNFETCLNRAKGHLVHLLHGDDKVLDGYYARMAALLQKFPEAGAAFCRFQCINEHNQQLYLSRQELPAAGILPDWFLTISERQRIQYATITVRRQVYEKLGAFYGITYGEDWEMWVRIAKHYPVVYTPEILAQYRMHATSISGSKFLSGGHLQDLHQAMLYIQQHLPEEQKTSILKRSRRYYAFYGLKVANRLWQQLRNEAVIKAQISQILQLHGSVLLSLALLKLRLKLKLHRLWH